MSPSLAIALALVAGCASYDQPWDLRAGLATQPIARADLGVADQTSVALGDLWLSLDAYNSGDASYPVVAAASGLAIESAFDPGAVDPRGTIVTSTRLSQGTEGAAQHPTTQFATVNIAASGPLATGLSTITLELSIEVPHICDPPPTELTGTIAGCFTDPHCTGELVHQDDGSYLVGSLVLWLDVLPHQCAD